MKAAFRPRARLLKLLGDQLIGTPQLAIFELVKNSYDADAESVEITIKNPTDKSHAIIEITDFGGEGMSLDTIVNVWLEPGADHKEKQKLAGIRTKKYDRLPLGEKGVGRFAVHKLGEQISLITKSADAPEVSLNINWQDLGNHKYIEDAKIEITENHTPTFFKNGDTGTRIVISKLNAALNKNDVRNLHRNIQSIQSPFEHSDFKIDPTASDFDVNLIVDGHADWTEDLLDMQTIIDQALFKFSFMIENGKWSWLYKFTPTEALSMAHNLEIIEKTENDAPFEFLKEYQKEYKEHKDGYFDDLGVIFGEIYVFDFDTEVRKFYNETGVIKTFLRENKGIRVYRDGMRVYNYGEPHDDWLEMDRSRVQRIAVNLNRDITVGAVSLDLSLTPNLIEKTNREGFIENQAYRRLKAVTQSAIEKLQKLRLIDKDRLRTITKSDVKSSITEIENPIEELKELAIKKGWISEILPTISRIERSYNDMRDIMLTAGMAGLNMSVAFHEIHRGIKDTKKIVEAGKDVKTVLKQFDRFELLLDTYAKLLKKEKPANVKLTELLSDNMELADARFEMHDIIYSCPALVGDEPDYVVKAPRGLMTSAINNLIDNSIYWLDQKWGTEKKKKYLYIGVSEEFKKGPAIIVADNGPGWRNISPEEMVKPFLTTKPGGMGIGMYYSDTVMEMLGGELVILQPGQVDVPEQASGAVVALVFNGGTVCKN